MGWKDEPRIRDATTGGRKISYNEYVKRFKARPTNKIIAEYKNNNSEFRAYARQELKRRGVSTTVVTGKRKRSVTRSPFDFGAQRFRIPRF